MATRRFLESEDAARSVEDLRDEIVTPGTRIAPGSPISRVIEELLRHPESRVVHVVDEEGKLLGTVSWRSVLRAASARLGVRSDRLFSLLQLFRELGHEDARDIMRAPVTVVVEEKLGDVLLKMDKLHENDVALVDGEGRYLGEVNGMRIMRIALETFKSTEAALDRARRGEDRIT